MRSGSANGPATVRHTQPVEGLVDVGGDPWRPSPGPTRRQDPDDGLAMFRFLTYPFQDADGECAEPRIRYPGPEGLDRIRAEGPHIQLWLNGTQTVDYTEPDDTIPRTGRIAVQIHGGAPSECWYKDIVIEELQ